MVPIAAGEFLGGEVSEGAAELHGTGAGRRVTLALFAIDRVPVTERDYARFVAETGRAIRPTERDADGRVPAEVLERHDRARSSVSLRYGAHPAVLVAWDDARDYCAWRHARLPDENEWEKAARGTDGRAFPWGERSDPTRVNSAELGAGDTVPVLTFPLARSPFDVHDCAGNAAEWTATPGSSPDHFIVRGSSWNEPASAGRLDRRRAFTRSSRSVTITFRCARTPSP